MIEIVWAFFCLFCTGYLKKNYLCAPFSGCGGIGRHARLRIWCLRAWEFDSPRGHHRLSRRCMVHLKTYRGSDVQAITARAREELGSGAVLLSSFSQNGQLFATFGWEGKTTTTPHQRLPVRQMGTVLLFWQCLIGF